MEKSRSTFEVLGEDALKKNGILVELNRQFGHPNGLHIRVKNGSLEVLQPVDGDDTLSYADDSDEAVKASDDFCKRGKNIAKRRQEKLGYVTQELSCTANVCGEGKTKRTKAKAG